MILRKRYYSFDDRCLTHKGVVIDIGCLNWDWSTYFLDKNKRVIGFDCNEEKQPPGAELRKQLIMPFSGEYLIYSEGQGASTTNLNNATGVKQQAVSFDSVLAEFPIMPSLIKMNIEGAEYPLLFSLKNPPSDQLIVSFHDWGNFPYSKQLSEIVRQHLSVWYDWRLTYGAFSWWLGLLKNEYRI